MNKTKIEWADYTWNPVTGCLHGCNYCYARRMAKRFSRGTGEGVNPPAYYIPGAGYIRDTEHNSFIENANIHVVKWPMYDEWIIREGEYNYRYDPFPYGFEPTFHRYRLDEPQKVKTPSKIFSVSMGDLFGNWVPDEWIDEVFTACFNADWHTYYFLTKNPARYERAIARYDGEERGFDIEVWDHIWFGATVTCQEDTDRLADLMKFREGRKFASIEPLLGPMDIRRYLQGRWSPDYEKRCWHLIQKYDGRVTDATSVILKPRLDWVIIGAQTGPGAKPPKPEWVQAIIDQCGAAGVPVFLKDNLKWPVKIQEWPE
jgi:protein gp37